MAENVHHIIHIQSLWRGYTARRYTNMLKTSQIGASKYFTLDEARETIDPSRLYNPNQALEKRPPFTFKSGAVYEGEWLGGFRHGQGTQLWVDGACYDGQWAENRAHGLGKFTHVDGDVYEGDWANDKANGQGVYQHVNGAKYDGQWSDDLQHGKGTETWADGSCYQGDYANGRKHGIGGY